MTHGIYKGPIRHLQGKAALLQGHGTRVLAQFDDVTLTLSGQSIPKRTVLEYEPHAKYPTEQQVDFQTPPADCLGFGWHEFNADDFKEIPR